MCISRIENRVAKGGHNVYSEDVIRRFFRSKQNFFTVKDLVSYWALYYNGNSKCILVAQGKDSYIDVIDDSLYNNFIEEKQ
jgi:predicted ABC-type ATPase